MRLSIVLPNCIDEMQCSLSMRQIPRFQVLESNFQLRRNNEGGKPQERLHLFVRFPSYFFISARGSEKLSPESYAFIIFPQLAIGTLCQLMGVSSTSFSVGLYQRLSYNIRRLRGCSFEAILYRGCPASLVYYQRVSSKSWSSGYEDLARHESNCFPSWILIWHPPLPFFLGSKKKIREEESFWCIVFFLVLLLLHPLFFSPLNEQITTRWHIGSNHLLSIQSWKLDA